MGVKIFLWPLLGWALATRRLAAGAIAVAVGLVTTFETWALIGFAGLTTYPDLLSRITDESSYSIEDVAEAQGFGVSGGRTVTLLVGGLLVAGCFVLARRGDDERSFFLAIAAAVALSPIVWLHYLVLLAVPLGIARPRFSAIWLLPIVLWVCPRSGNGVGLEPFLPLVVTGIVVAAIVLRPEPRSNLVPDPA